MARPLLSLCPLAGLSAGSQACAEAICSLGSLLHKGLFAFIDFPCFFPPHLITGKLRKKERREGGNKALWMLTKTSLQTCSS